MVSGRLSYLFGQCFRQMATPSERAELQELLVQPEWEAAIDHLLAAEVAPGKGSHSMTGSERDTLLQYIFEHDDEQIASTTPRRSAAIIEQPAGPMPIYVTRWQYAAAVLLLIAGTATYLYKAYYPPQKEKALSTMSAPPTDIPPGGHKAILTLADGNTIVLDTAANGAVASQGATHILKTDAGSLTYQSAAGAGSGELLYNTVTTPKGGQYQIGLPDGSKVWLNAASSVRFPASFGSERRVAVTGEVYFEIAGDKTKPFFVIAGDEEVQVLGTSFNVNAYPEEGAVKISLQKGAVRIGSVVLKPGQALLGGEVTATNLDLDLAWKNGFFSFHNADLPAVMRQLARWYNVDVKYAGKIPSMELNGKIGRDLTLSEVLFVLGKTKVKYRMEGNHTIVILP